MHLHRHSAVWGNEGGIQRETKGMKLCRGQRQKSEVQVSHVPFQLTELPLPPNITTILISITYMPLDPFLKLI